MCAYWGNTVHKDITKQNNDSKNVNVWSNVRCAQGIINNTLESHTKDDCISLVKKLFNSTVRSDLEGEGYLTNAASTVFDWTIKTSFESARSVFLMLNGLIHNLKDWQFEMYSKIVNKSDLIKIHLFEKHDVCSFWIITTDNSVNNILDYSSVYTNILKKYNNIKCDFMVFGEDEITDIDLPTDVITLDVKENTNV
jgi:hypothetical protein